MPIDMPRNPQNNGAPIQNWYNLRAERSISGLDVTHDVAFNYVIELPFGPGKALLGDVRGVRAKLVGGWQINGVTSYRGGYPISVSSATVAGGGNRPNTTGISAALIKQRPLFGRSAHTMVRHDAVQAARTFHIWKRFPHPASCSRSRHAEP